MEERSGGIPWKDMFLGWAVVSFLCLAPGIIPFLGGIITLFTPIAVLYYLAKFGWGFGLTIFGLAIIFSLFLWPLLGGSPGYYPLIEIILLGPVLFGLLRKGFSITKTVAYATGLLLFVLFALLVLWGIHTAHNPYQAVVSEINQNLEAAAQFYQELKVPEAALEAMQEALDNAKSILGRFWPGLVAASLLVLVWINVCLGDRILRRYGLEGFKFGELSRWSLPENLVWLVILAGALVVLPYPGPRTVGVNLLIFLAPAYFFQGLAIVSFYVKKYRLSRLMRLLLYSLICVQTYMIVIVAVAGLFDVWSDFRRLKRAQDKPEIL